MEIKDIKQLALDLSSHSCPSSNLFFSKNRASAKKLLVELHSPWRVGMWAVREASWSLQLLKGCSFHNEGSTGS